MDAEKEIQLLRNRLKRFEERVERLMERADQNDKTCQWAVNHVHSMEQNLYAGNAVQSFGVWLVQKGCALIRWGEKPLPYPGTTKKKSSA